MEKVWLIASGKGGTGKSALAVNLAAALAAAGRRVLLVDLSIGLRSLDLCLGLADRVLFDVMDVMGGFCRPSEAILRHPAIAGLSLLPAAQTRSCAELDGGRLLALCGLLADDYDLILLDCPPGLEPLLGQAARAAGQAILVATQEPAALRDADRAAAELALHGVTGVYLVINRFRAEPASKLQQPKAAELAEVVGLPLLGVIPEDPIVFQATLTGDVACRLQPDSPAAVAFLTIARRIPGRTHVDA